MAESKGPKPLTQVFETANARGLSAGPAVWEKFVDAGFDLKISRQGQHAYGLDEETENHFYELLAIRQRIPERFRTAAVAFELAIAGSKKAPAGLVHAELRRRLDAMYHFIKRVLRRQFGLPVRTENATHEHVRNAARAAAKSATKRIKLEWVRKLVALTWEFLFSRLFEMMYLHEDIRKNARPFDELLKTWFSRPNPGDPPRPVVGAQPLREFFFLIHDVRDVLVLDPKKNLLYRALEEEPNPTDDAALLEICNLDAPVINAVIICLNIIATLFPNVIGKIITPRRLYYYMSGVTVGMLYAQRKTRATQKVIADLRSGKNPVDEMVPIAAEIARRLGGNVDDIRAAEVVN
jgi:hypothetical protein